jgi:hypothetical protein
LQLIVEVDEQGVPVEVDEADQPMPPPTPVGQLPIGDEKALDRGSMAGQDSLVIPSGSADPDAEATVVELSDPEDEDDEKPPSRRKK